MIKEQEPLSDCEHHWVIESPNGPTSTGVCKVCGSKSEFKNSIPGSGWDRVGSKKRGRQPSARSSER